MSRKTFAVVCNAYVRGGICTREGAERVLAELSANCPHEHHIEEKEE